MRANIASCRIPLGLAKAWKMFLGVYNLIWRNGTSTAIPCMDQKQNSAMGEVNLNLVTKL